MDLAQLRHKVFKAAGDYHAALVEYWYAMEWGLDLETPSQVLVGKGIFYHVALSELSSVEKTPRLQERLAFLRTSQVEVSRLYALVKRRARRRP